MQFNHANEAQNKIVTAFQVLIMKKSLERITIKDITELAQINRSTFYAYYEDKYDLFNQLLTEAIQQQINQDVVEQQMNERYISELLYCVYSYLNQVKTHCAYTYQQFFPLLRQLFVPFIKDHIGRRVGSTGLSVLQVSMYARLIYESAEMLMIEGKSYEVSDVAKEINQLLKL